MIGRRALLAAVVIGALALIGPWLPAYPLTVLTQQGSTQCAGAPIDGDQCHASTALTCAAVGSGATAPKPCTASDAATFA